MEFLPKVLLTQVLQKIKSAILGLKAYTHTHTANTDNEYAMNARTLLVL